ncbi:MAG: hypothetical protein ABIH63_03250 [archaeon]
MKRTTLTLIIFLILFLILLVTFVIFSNPVEEEGPVVYNKTIMLEPGNGAVINIWIDSFSRFDKLKDHGVRYLFVDVGDTGKDGKIKTPESEIKDFLDFIGRYESENNYDFIILPYSEVIAEDCDISSESFKNNFVWDYTRLDSLGFDGILVDIEGIPLAERAGYLSLLERLRERLQKNSIISVYAGALSDSHNEWEWNYDFYKSVSERVDLVSASGYDSDIADAAEYKTYIRDQVALLSSQNFNTYFLFAVPTHKDYPETIDNALSAYTSEVKKYPENKFLGICIFAEWTVNEDEWKVIDRFIY